MSRRVALALAVLAVSLVSPLAQAAPPAEVVIGAVYPLSGNLAKVGNDIKDAIELAAELVNDDVNVPVPLGKGKGLPNLWVPGERDFFPIPGVPELGAGKLDLKRIKELALERTKSS